MSKKILPIFKFKEAIQEKEELRMTNIDMPKILELLKEQDAHNFVDGEDQKGKNLWVESIVFIIPS